MRAAIGQHGDVSVPAAEDHQRFVADRARQRLVAELGGGRGRVPLIAEERRHLMSPLVTGAIIIARSARRRGEDYSRSTATTRPFSTASESRPCLSASAFSPKSSRRQPDSAGTSASSSAAMRSRSSTVAITLAATAVSLRGHAQQHLEQLHRGLAVDAAASWRSNRGSVLGSRARPALHRLDDRLAPFRPLEALGSERRLASRSIVVGACTAMSPMTSS